MNSNLKPPHWKPMGTIRWVKSHICNEHTIVVFFVRVSQIDLGLGPWNGRWDKAHVFVQNIFTFNKLSNEVKQIMRPSLLTAVFELSTLNNKSWTPYHPMLCMGCKSGSGRGACGEHSCVAKPRCFGGFNYWTHPSLRSFFSKWFSRCFSWIFYIRRRLSVFDHIEMGPSST